MAQSPSNRFVLRGQIYHAELKPQNPKYPNEPLRDGRVVVASVNELNEAVGGTVIIFPISKSVYRDNPNQVFLKPDKRNNLQYESAILPLHVRGIPKARLQKQDGLVTAKQLEEALGILKLALGIDLMGGL